MPPPAHSEKTGSATRGRRLLVRPERFFWTRPRGSWWIRPLLEAADQPEVRVVREVPARAVMVGSRHPVVLDDVLAIHLYLVPPAAVGREPRRGSYLGVGPGRAFVRPPAVLDADRVLVVRPVARVPGDVLVPDALDDRPLVANHVVGGDVCSGVLEPANGTSHGALGDVDDQPVYVDVPFAVELPAVVAAVGGSPGGPPVVRRAAPRRGDSRNLRVLRVEPQALPGRDGRVGPIFQRLKDFEGVEVDAPVLGDGLPPAVEAVGLRRAGHIGEYGSPPPGGWGPVVLQFPFGEPGQAGGPAYSVPRRILVKLHDAVGTATVHIAGLVVRGVGRGHLPVRVRVAHREEQLHRDPVLFGRRPELFGQGRPRPGQGPAAGRAQKDRPGEARAAKPEKVATVHLRGRSHPTPFAHCFPLRKTLIQPVHYRRSKPRFIGCPDTKAVKVLGSTSSIRR